MNTSSTYERYQRQVILKEFGEAGQQRLLNAAVLVIGAGGLGCPALQYLAAAGVGTIGMVDDDIVSLSNLHRQVLYTTRDIGFFKVDKATQVLQQLNPGINITACNERLTNQNALEIIKCYDIIIDCTDNFASRYLVNDACVLLNKPLVFGAVSQFEGQVAVFNFQYANGTASANYRDLFPQPPVEGEVLNCTEAGVLGVLPGIIGTMQANETIKLLTGMGKPLVDALFTYNALNNHVFEIALSRRQGTRLLIPKDEKAFLEMDYDWLCNMTDPQFELDAAGFDKLLLQDNIQVVDVREWDELPEIKDFTSTRIPLSKLGTNLFQFNKETIVFLCQTGKRSLLAAGSLNETLGKTKKLYSLRGGIANWLTTHQTQNS